MAGEVEWVFESDAPLDAWQAALVRGLVSKGYRLLPVKAFDFGVERGGARLFLKAEFVAEGVRVTVKPKTSMFESPAPVLQEAWSVCREAQLALAHPPL